MKFAFRIFLCSILFVGWVIVSPHFIIPYKLASTSPKQIYQAGFYERYSPGVREFFFPYMLYLTLSKNGQPFEDVAIGGWGRPKNWLSDYEAMERFGERFTTHRWESENLLSFRSRIDSNTSSGDWIYVHNATEKVITYLRVDTSFYDPDEMFLIFDIAPKSSVSFRASKLNHNLSFLECSGRLNGPIDIPESYLYFGVDPSAYLPTSYCITIRNNGAIFRSERFEGSREQDMRYQGEGIKLSDDLLLRTPRVTSCQTLSSW